MMDATFDLVSDEIGRWAMPVHAGTHVIVPTYSMYPSNSAVQVFIEGGANTFVVSDGGGALESIHNAGALQLKAMRYLKDAATRSGLRVSLSGWIYASGVPRKMLTTSISMVAESSKSAADLLLRHFKPDLGRDFRRDLDRVLATAFSNHMHRNGKLLGASNKSHSFDYVIDVGDIGKLVVDAVVPDANSINSAIVAHLDLRAAHREDVKQRIVFDDRMKWRSSDLALLKVGAPPIAYTEVTHSLQRLIA